MPIEIKELLIEINVTPDDKDNSGAKDSSTVSSQLLADYAEQIMEAIDNKKER